LCFANSLENIERSIDRMRWALAPVLA